MVTTQIPTIALIFAAGFLSGGAFFLLIVGEKEQAIGIAILAALVTSQCSYMLAQ